MIFPFGPLVLMGAGAMLSAPLSLSTVVGGLGIAAIALILAACVWLIMISCIAGPVWWVLHTLGLRSWPWAMTVGAVSLAGFMGLTDNPGVDIKTLVAGPLLVFEGVMLSMAAVVGAAFGFLIWRIAYRPIGKDQPRA